MRGQLKELDQYTYIKFISQTITLLFFLILALQQGGVDTISYYEAHILLELLEAVLTLISISIQIRKKAYTN